MYRIYFPVWQDKAGVFMKCMYCRSTKTQVLDSVATTSGVIRRRKCKSCGKTFYTEENSKSNQYELRAALNHFREEQRYKTKTGESTV